MRIISRGISNLEDVEVLTKEEIKEVVRVGILGSEMLLVHPFSNIDGSVAPIVDWSFISPISPFFLGLFVDFGISDIVETSLDIRLSF